MEEASLTPSPSDNFTDAQHKEQDEEITQAASGIFAGQQELSTLECAVLLQCIINHSERKLQAAFTNAGKAIELMRENPELGIDGIIPFLITGYTISLNNIGVFLWQAANDSKFTDNPDPSLFEAMNLYRLGILNTGDNIPIIRIVFALASKTPCLTRVARQDGFESFDFWVGGISPAIFLPVGERDASIWTALLQATYGWEDVYKNNPEGRADKAEEDLRRSMNPGAAEDEQHWENWADFTAMGNIKANEHMDVD